MKSGDTREQTEVAVFSLLEAGLDELGLSADSRQIEQLVDLVLLLEHWASRINLTGHRGPTEMASRLVLDAAALCATLPELHETRTLADLGSGAGFPGLPIAILNPEVAVCLVDSRLKRNHFQRTVRRSLGLENVTSILGRSDEVDQVPSDLVVAQAMTQPDRALELMLQWCRPKSTVVLPASDAATKPNPPPGIQELELREYHVPGTSTHRKLWVGRVHLPE